VFNLPNLLSAIRLLLCIPIVALVLVDQPAALLAATALFAIASITDNLDGRLARKLNQVSDVGIFLDLTADKVFVGAIGVACVQVGLLPAWIPITILSRDFLVTGLRSVAAARGQVIPAGSRGKQKQTLILVGLGGILLARGLKGATTFPLGLSTGKTGKAPRRVPDYMLALSNAILLAGVVWTVVSAVDYLRAGWRVLDAPTTAPKAAEPREKRVVRWAP
jgi:CDP-diacylglycerol--glycerol-3-phosphate 3-phosphatidyltransferase